MTVSRSGASARSAPLITAALVPVAPDVYIWLPWCVQQQLQDSCDVVLGGKCFKMRLCELLHPLLQQGLIRKVQQTCYRRAHSNCCVWRLLLALQRLDLSCEP
jgi:hypothetical protein